MARREFQRRQQRLDRQKGRRQEKQQRRESSIQARDHRERTRQRGRFLVRLAWVAGGALLVGIIVWAVVYTAFRPQPGQLVASQGNVHIQNATDQHPPYNTSPPTSGHHLSNIAQPGIFAEPILNELQVHNLEDGFVVIQYDCPEGCPELVQGLEAVVRPYLNGSRRVLMGPYSGIRDLAGEPRRIALTAWTRIDTFDILDADRVRTFIDAYEGIDHHPAS